MPERPRHSLFALKAVVPTQPFVFLFGVFLLGLIFFAAFRLLFLLSYSQQLAGSTVLDVLNAFAVGVRFDQIVILAILLPPLLVLPWLPLRHKTVRAVTFVWLGLAFGVSFLAVSADIPFYKVFESRLNFQAVEYLGGGRTTRHLIFTDPRFYQILALWLVATALFIAGIVLLRRRFRNLPQRRSWIGQAVLTAVIVIIAGLGIRGRTYLSPMNWGIAYISQNQFINQLGLNGMYTFARVFTEEGGDPRLVYLPESARFAFQPFHEALDSVRAILHTDNDNWLEPDSSLRRLTRQPASSPGFPPNIVIVMMESWSGRFTGALGATRGLTPRFDSLAAHGILFTRFYGNGTRTNFGLAATFCSYPSIPGRSVMARFSAWHPFKSLPLILRRRGYTPCFAYGGDLAFDNMEGFFRTQGVDRFYGDDDFGRHLEFAKWGIPDEIVFQKVTGLADSLPRPFQITIMTLSNHEPFDLPDSSVQKYFDRSDTSRIYNALAYADFALGQFIDSISAKPVFDSTIFVFTSDHAHYSPAWLTLDPLVNFHTPLLIYSPALFGDSGRTIDIVGSQVDFIPTLMHLLGDNYTHESWGRDLLSLPPDDSGFAIVDVLNRSAYIGPNLFYVENIGRPGKLLRSTGALKKGLPTYEDVDNPRVLDLYRRRLHSYLQLADQLSTPGALDIAP